MKKVLSFVLSAILCIGVVASLSFGFTGWGKDENTLVVGYTIYAPMNYYDDNGEFVGHDTELAELVCEKLGYEVKFVEIQWDYKVMELESNNIDLIWNGMTITDELKESILISDPYMINQQVIVTKSDNASKYNTRGSCKCIIRRIRGWQCCRDRHNRSESAVKRKACKRYLPGKRALGS